MAASSSSPPSGNRPRRGWRYSLRALLIVVTLACVGVWYWYRVPYAEDFYYPKGNPKALYVAYPIVAYAAKDVRHSRRVLYGEPIREGMTEYFDHQGRRIGQEYWREGKLHGQFTLWHANGQQLQRGEYHMGQKTGTWELFEQDGKCLLRMLYAMNHPHGEAQWFENGTVKRVIQYNHGEVTAIDGTAVDDPLGRARRLGQIDNEQIAEMLEKRAETDFEVNPLNEVADYISETYRVNVALDKSALYEVQIQEELPITLRERHINAGTMLVLLCEPHGLAATYRWGMIWITTKEEARNWVDRTGVSNLLTTLPPGASTRDRDVLRAALETPAQFDFIDTPLYQAAQFLTDTYRVEFTIGDDSIKNLPTSSSLRGMSLQNALGALCDHHSLRLRWKERKKLVFEPQEPADK